MKEALKPASTWSSMWQWKSQMPMAVSVLFDSFDLIAPTWIICLEPDHSISLVLNHDRVSPDRCGWQFGV